MHQFVHCCSFWVDECLVFFIWCWSPCTAVTQIFLLYWTYDVTNDFLMENPISLVLGWLAMMLDLSFKQIKCFKLQKPKSASSIKPIRIGIAPTQPSTEFNLTYITYVGLDENNFPPPPSTTNTTIPHKNNSNISAVNDQIVPKPW